MSTPARMRGAGGGASAPRQPENGPLAASGFAVGYVVHPGAEEALETAKAALKAVARRRSLPWASCYVEGADPGSRRRRPRLQRLLGRARAGGPRLVVVLRLGELSGSAEGVAGVVAQLVRAGVQVEAADGFVVDPDDQTFRWLLHGRAARRGQARSDVDERRQRGERVGNLRWGDRLAADGKHVERDEREQEVVAHVRRLHAAGKTPPAIARAWRPGVASAVPP